VSVRTRFAPSPTGSLHIGGARTALFNWLFARHEGGEFILRIEDTDQERSTEESIAEIIEAMKWLGLDWDEGPYRQSGRVSIYQEHAEKLLREEKAYRCYCTPEELEEKRKRAQAEGKAYRYDGRCRDLRFHPVDKPFAVRLKVPEVGEITVEDIIRGNITFDAKEIDDFVILRGDGFPTYNFAVVIDDATMDITHVIRGDDHISNTPKQIHLYQALGYEVSRFAHVSMILGSDKTRLSKRHGATSVLAYKEMGYLPEALVNYLVRLGWSYGDQEIFSKEELIEKFTLESVGKSPAVFNPEKLLWLNGWYIRNKSTEEIAELALPFFTQKGFTVKMDVREPSRLSVSTEARHEGSTQTQSNDERFLMIVESLQERAKTLRELVDSADYFFTDTVEYEEKARSKFLIPEVVPIFETLIENLSTLRDFTVHGIERIFQGICQERDANLFKVAQPVRVALTGKTVSPGIFEVIQILGKEETIKRLERAVKEASGKMH